MPSFMISSAIMAAGLIFNMLCHGNYYSFLGGLVLGAVTMVIDRQYERKG